MSRTIVVVAVCLLAGARIDDARAQDATEATLARIADNSVRASVVIDELIEADRYTLERLSVDGPTSLRLEFEMCEGETLSSCSGVPRQEILTVPMTKMKPNATVIESDDAYWWIVDGRAVEIECVEAEKECMTSTEWGPEASYVIPCRTDAGCRAVADDFARLVNAVTAGQTLSSTPSARPSDGGTRGGGTR